LSSRYKASLYLSRYFGYDTGVLMMIISALFVLITFFYVYSFATYFKINTWDMQDRVSYYSYFATYVISRNVDHLLICLAAVAWLHLSLKHRLKFVIATIYGIIALVSAIFGWDVLLDILAIISLPTLIILISINSLTSKKFLISNRSLVINYLAIVGIGTGLLSLSISLQPFYLPDKEIIFLRSIAYEIFLIFIGLSPILLILLILGLPVKMITDASIRTIQKTNNRFTDYFTLAKSKTGLSKKVILILFFMMLSATMVILPHQGVTNKDNQDVGVDTHFYVQEIGALMNTTSVNELLYQTFVTIQHGDRPFTLFFFLIVAKIMPSDDLSYVFDNIPIILGPALVLAVYFLARQLTSNDIASLLSALITAISFQTLVGIYAGSYANWLALIVGYLSVVFLFRSLKRTNKLNVCLFLILLITIFFTHIYTWSILSIVMGIFLLVLLKTKSYERKNIIILLIVLSSSVFLDVIRTTMTGGFSGIAYDISPPFGSIVRLGPEQFSTRWTTIADTTLSYFGSLFGNPIIYALGLYWLIRSKLRDVSTIFIVTFLSIGMIPLFLGNWIVQARVFYDIPFQIPAAIALTYLCQRRNGTLILIAVSIWLVALSIRAVSNFYLVPPPLT
jgi:hypothetical protein